MQGIVIFKSMEEETRYAMNKGIEKSSGDNCLGYLPACKHIKRSKINDFLLNAWN
jgi:hypothetical protein